LLRHIRTASFAVGEIECGDVAEGRLNRKVKDRKATAATDYIFLMPGVNAIKPQEIFCDEKHEKSKNTKSMPGQDSAKRASPRAFARTPTGANLRAFRLFVFFVAKNLTSQTRHS
jgi:hypothetical protein